MAKDRGGYWWRALALVIAVIAVSAPCGAQRLAVQGVVGSSSHDLLGKPRGIGGSLTFSGDARVRLMLIAETLRSESSGTGVVCAGLIDPTRCPEESFEQVGHLSGAGIGVAIRVIRLPVVELELVPGALFGRARTEMHGLQTRNNLAAENSEVRVSVGAELRLMPSRSVPVDVFVGGNAGGIGPLGSANALDKYEPFNQWETMQTAYAGAAFRWGRAARR